VNMQTSFMHPPFGFALFYLRSVAPQTDYVDKITGNRVEKVTTGQIYRGAIPFVVIQIIMVGMVITFPALVTGGLDKVKTMDAGQVLLEIQQQSSGSGSDPANSATDTVAPPAANDDPMKALQDQLKSEAAKKQ